MYARYCHLREVASFPRTRSTIGYDVSPPSASEYDDDVTAESQALIAAAIESGRHGYVAPDVAELVEAIDIKEYEVRVNQLAVVQSRCR